MGAINGILMGVYAVVYKSPNKKDYYNYKHLDYLSSTVFSG